MAFDALEQAYEVVKQLGPIEQRIAQKNRELYEQLSDASMRMVLCLSEGRARRRGDRRKLWEAAEGSAAEVTDALRLAVVKGWIDDASAVEPHLDRVRAMLWRLTH